jgi:hypothetical protein
MPAEWRLERAVVEREGWGAYRLCDVHLIYGGGSGLAFICLVMDP